jgi:hypothetical protein
MDQINSEHAIYAIIIFPFCALKFVKATFRIEYDQRVIIKFLLNEGADARDIADILQTDCMHSLVNMLINFEQFNSGLQRYGSVAKTSSEWSWCQNYGYIRQISFWINSFDSWDTLCCSFNGVIAFTWLCWLQIVPFALGAASVDAWFARKTKREC